MKAISKYIKEIRNMSDKELKNEKRNIIEEIAMQLYDDPRLQAIDSEMMRRSKERQKIIRQLFDVEVD